MADHPQKSCAEFSDGVCGKRSFCKYKSTKKRGTTVRCEVREEELEHLLFLTGKIGVTTIKEWKLALSENLNLRKKKLKIRKSTNTNTKTTNLRFTKILRN